MRTSKIPLLAMVALLLLSPVLAAANVHAAALIWTDQSDYQAGTIVTIYGESFILASAITVSVTDPAGSVTTWQVTATLLGGFTTTYQLQHVYGTYYVTASDGINTAQTSFHDAGAAANLDQCANGTFGPPLARSPCLNGVLGGTSYADWVNGNVNSAKAHWREGEFVSYRVTIVGLTEGAHTLDFDYQTVHSNTHALDYLGSVNASETFSTIPSLFHANNNNPCIDKLPSSQCSPATTNPAGFVQVPAATLVNCGGSAGTFTGTQAPGRVFIWGPAGTTLDTFTYTSQNVLQGTGQCGTSVRLGFHSGTGTTTVVIAWGGHIASQSDWGSPNSASAINGSPYHMALDFLDGTTVGSQDRALSSSAIFFVPTVSTIVKNSAGVAVTTVTVGTSVHDTAILSSSSSNAGGTATYTLWNTGLCSGTKLSTQTVTVSNAIIPDTLPFTPTIAGSYSYNVTYSGDNANYIANGACEPFTATSTTPNISTSVTPSTITLASSTTQARDTATLSNGVNPTGSITFTVYNNPTCTGTPVYTSTPITVNGNGAYTSPAYTPPATGTYYWIASYSGDSNNNPISGACGATGETLTVQAAGPIITTTASPSTLTLSSISPASDTATLTGGYNPTGSITFNVYSNSLCSGAPVFTSPPVTVTGNGAYTSASFTPTAAGSYYWVASYTGDSNNNLFVAPCGASGETLVVQLASPVITTQVSPSTIILTSSAGSATDTAILSSGFSPTGIITFQVYPASTNCLGTPLFTSTVQVNGNGNYVSGPFTPSGTGTYNWVASYSGDNNDNPYHSPCGDNGETLTVLAASPTIVTQVSPSTITLTTTASSATDTATLSGGFGTPQGTITFNVYPSSASCLGTPFFTSTVVVNGNGVYVSTAFTPPGAGTYYWVASYSGDANNNPFTAPCGVSGETLTVQPAIPTIITNVSPSTITLTATTSSSAIDTATLSGSFGSPKGTITFNVFADPSCTGSPVFTSTVSVNGNGDYSSAAFTPSGAGVYRWMATYSGDKNNNPSTDPCGAGGEVLTVQPASPTVSTVATPQTMTLTTTAGLASDTAILSGGYGTPVGTLTFSLYYHSASCTGTPLYTSVVPVNGNGNYQSGSYTPPGVGSYDWRVVYSGDANNNPYIAPCDPDPETLTIQPAQPTIRTSVSPSTVVLASSSNHAVDAATLSNGFGTPQGTITFTVYASSTNCNGTPVFTSTVNVNGNGVYHSASFTPSQVGTYLWVASYSGDTNNNPFTAPCGADGETLAVQPAQPSITTFVSPANITTAGSASDTATLSGGQSSTGTITFTVFSQNSTCNGAPVFTSIVNVNGNGNYASAPFTNPALGTYNWVASYSGDSNNNPASGACGALGETLFVVRASPTIATSAQPSTMTLTTSAGSAHDTATLSSGSHPTGSITFTLYYSSQACSAIPLFTSVVSVSGNGNYASASYTPPGAGTYNWLASYSGDSDNNPYTASCGANGETLTVYKANPTVTTRVLDSSGRDVTFKMSGTGVSIHDTAILTGTFPIANGTLTYYFYHDGLCSNPLLSSQTVTVIGGNVPDAWSQILPLGTYGYLAVYSGDSNNNGARGACEPFTSGIPVNAVTDTPIPYGSNVAMCNFDYNPTQQAQQFRLIFTQNSSATYGLNAGNPGQFVYNVFQFNGTSVNITASIPYPFVTQGSVPVHIYDSVTIVTINGVTCYVPGNDVTPSYTITPGPVGITTLANYPGQFGTYATINVNGPLPSTGQAYIWIHVDYGLKKTTGYQKVSNLKTGTRKCDLTGNDNDANATLTGTAKASICDNDIYTFSAVGTITPGLASSWIQNNNVFKRDPGVAGLITQPDGTPVSGATVQIYDNNGKLVATVTTDQDGYFAYTFKYTGKQATYTIVVTTSWCSITQTFDIKSNKSVWVDVTAPYQY